MTEPSNVPAAGHDHQEVDQWAERGLAQSVGRVSAESDIADEVAAAPPSNTAQPEPVAPEANHAQPEPVGPALTEQPDDAAQTEAEDAHSPVPGQPGTITNAGNESERAAFTGDGAYSGGQFADLTYPSASAPLQD